jgi:hypothetical protein
MAPMVAPSFGASQPRAYAIAQSQLDRLEKWTGGKADRIYPPRLLDHVVVFNEQHLRHLLKSYKQYYNEFRTHLSLDKDAPIPRDAHRVGRVLSLPILGGTAPSLRPSSNI